MTILGIMFNVFGWFIFFNIEEAIFDALLPFHIPGRDFLLIFLSISMILIIDSVVEGFALKFFSYNKLFSLIFPPLVILSTVWLCCRSFDLDTIYVNVFYTISNLFNGASDIPTLIQYQSYPVILLLGIVAVAVISVEKGERATKR